ncbi:MAG: hypothetical protein RLY86_2972 [Pseudomonadota bacterium]|jgi:hypothetical protein
MDEAVKQRIDRLEAIARVIRDSGRGLALLALGSAAETARMDAWSDLDFFAIVKPGEKAGFVQDLWWLRDAAPADAPLAWAFRNTADGWKACYADGVFVEMAVFEPAELAAIPFAPGRIVWREDGFDTSLCTPRIAGGFNTTDRDYLLGEILSNLYVGLGRWRRGERLAGMRSIQVYALDNLLRLEALTGPPGTGQADPFAVDRRAEVQNPDLAPLLPALAGGIDACPEAARAMLDHLAARFHPVSETMRRLILDLAAGE